ncbi:hypothetical protein AVEN_261821-1 [Araneus ventricosus]|uniref:Uncharacterized protein n=1 Tax=Araneus ventricosus TaxID=182803 RepID=A0A4Y2LYA3_ARAVE|nr:hypothetical protein AVEN_261821-1 [Araneus ventricosus]
MGRRSVTPNFQHPPRGSKPDSTQDPSHVKSLRMGAKRPPAGVVRKLGEEMPSQVSSASSAQGSKRRGPSAKYPRSTSKKAGS